MIYSTGKTKDQEEDERPRSLQDQLMEVIKKRESKQFSFKPRIEGQFIKKQTDHLSWRNYVRWFFNEHPDFEIQCCGDIYIQSQTLS